jgi:hypothetical protein
LEVLGGVEVGVMGLVVDLGLVKVGVVGIYDWFDSRRRKG